MNLLQIATKRRATKSYNSELLIDQKDLKYIFEVTNTAPTSIGLELWRAISLRDKNVKAKLAMHTIKNEKSFMNSSDVIIFVTKTESFIRNNQEFIANRAKRYLSTINDEFGLDVSKIDEEKVNSIKNYVVSVDHGNNEFNYTEWSKRQAYIAAAYAMLAAQELEISSTPAEGFTKEFIEALKKENLIEADETVALLVFLGYTKNMEHPHYGKKQSRDSVDLKFKII